MQDAQENHYDIYRSIGTYLIVILNILFLINVAIALLPYVEYQFRHNFMYKMLRDKIPYLKNHDQILEGEARARNNWNKVRILIHKLIHQKTLGLSTQFVDNMKKLKQLHDSINLNRS